MSELTNQFVAACLPPIQAHRGGSPEQAQQMLATDATLAESSIVAAVVSGNGSWAIRALQADPSLAQQTFAPQDWELLQYLCFSMIYRDEPKRRDDFHQIAAELLKQGANPNAYFMLGDEKETVLYGATGVANDPILGAMLLDAGADINDADASYHIAEHDNCDSIRLFVERGMDANLLATTLLHRLDYDDLDSIRTILDLGVDPNGRGGWGKTPLHQAIMRGRGLPFLKLLVEKGAEVDAKRDDGRTAYALAARIGRQDAMEFLVAQGAHTDLAPVDSLLAACSTGNVAKAQQVLATHDKLLNDLTETDQVAVVEAARDGNTTAVRCMLDCGIPIDTRGACGGMALHWAAWHARTETVQLLIERHAPLEARCLSYKCTPLGWAAHASSQHGAAEAESADEYIACCQALLAAGGKVEDDMLDDASPALQQVLRQHR